MSNDNAHNGGIDIASILPTMMMMKSDVPWLQMLLALVLPLFIRLASPRMQLWFNALKLGRHSVTRSIVCTKETGGYCWWVDEDDEEAYNAVIQKSILAYINKKLPHITKMWNSCEIHALKEAKNECAHYSYICVPQNEVWVDLKNGIEFNRSVRNNDRLQAGASKKSITTTFTVRAKCYKSVNAFIDMCIDNYNAELKSKVDTSRYMYQPSDTPIYIRDLAQIYSPDRRRSGAHREHLGSALVA